MTALLRFGLLLGLLLHLSGCRLPDVSSTGDHAAADTVFRLNLASEPPTLDPIRVTDLTSLNVVNQLMIGLTRLDAQGHVRPALAQRWTLSPDGKTIRFTLNPHAVWSDGRPVTAGQVLDGWQRALTAANGSEYAFFLFDIVNAKAYYDGKLRDFRQVGATAPDAHRLEVRLTRPIAFFPALMAMSVSYPVRADLIARYGERWTEAGCFTGNGPYLLRQWRHEDRIRLTPNPRSWLDPTPRVSVIDMAMVNDANTSMVLYDNHQLDYVESPTSLPSSDIRRLKGRPDFHQNPLDVIHYIGFNTRKPPFNDVRVRQAFAMALDRRYFPALLQGGQSPIQGFVTPGMPGYDPHIGLGFDPQRARGLLAAAGYPGGKGFPRVSFGFRSLYEVRKEAEIAQYLWQKHLGVTVGLANMDWKVYLSRLKTDPPPLYKLNWYVDYPDPDSFMGLFTTGNGNNHTGWTSQRYDALLRRAAGSRRPAERDRLYRLLQTQLLSEETVIAPLYTMDKSYLLSPRIHGLTVNTLNLMDLSHLSIAP